MATKTLTLGPFLGGETSLDSRSIPYTKSPSLQNVWIEDGALRVRRGYNNLSAIPSGFTGAFGYEYLKGYTTVDNGVTYSLAEEFVTVETRSGNTRPYSVNPSTGVRTEIKNGTSSVTLATTDWHGAAFRGDSYWWNGTVLARHIIGDNTSWVTLVQPAAPSSLTFSTGAVQTLANYTSSTLTPTGAAGTMSLPDAFHVKILNNGTATGAATATIDLTTTTPGLQDWQYQDSISFSIFIDFDTAIYIDTNPANINFTFLNNNSTPVTLTPTVTTAIVSASGGSTTIAVNLYFDGKLCDTVLGLTKVRLTTAAALTSTAAIIYNNGTAGVGATLTRGENGALGNIDGVAAIVGDRILVKDQATTYQNGIYTVTSVGSGGTPYVLTRATDFDQAADFATTLKAYATAGNTNTNIVYDASATTVTVGTTGLTFSAESADPNHRHQWSNVRKIVFAYQVASNRNTSSSYIRLSLPGLNRIDTINGWDAATSNLKFGCTAYSSTTGIESDIVTTTIQRSHFDSVRTTPNDPTHNNSTGSLVTLVGTTPSDVTVDKLRFYYFGTDGAYHLLAEQAKASNTCPIQVSNAEALLLTSFAPFSFQQGTILCAAAFNGSMVWSYKGGFKNIRFSKIGFPEQQASDSDDPSLGDQTLGATFSLADDYADDAIAMLQAGQAFLMFGSQGVYAMTGSYPTGMTAPHKLPQSKGIAGPYAACRWKDDAGNPCGVYLTSSGDVYMAIVNQYFDGNSTGYRMVEVTEGIRGFLETIRIAQSLSDYSTARIGVDSASDALWIILGTHAVVLRRRSEVSGKREWEHYSYGTSNSGTFKYIAFSESYGMRWLRSTGEIDENEIYSATKLPITGANRDGGNAMPSIFWTSKTFNATQNTRLDNITIYRDNLANTPSLTAISTRQTSTKTLASGKYKSRFGALQQGFEHQFVVTMAEQDAPIRKITVEAQGPIGTRALS